MRLDEKLAELEKIFQGLESVVVAYSGGVDSTLVFKVAHETLGERAVAATAVSASLPEYERIEAEQIAQQIGARHILIERHETEDNRYLANEPNRCYFCKSEVYDLLLDIAQKESVRHVVEGINLV